MGNLRRNSAKLFGEIRRNSAKFAEICRIRHEIAEDLQYMSGNRNTWEARLPIPKYLGTFPSTWEARYPFPSTWEAISFPSTWETLLLSQVIGKRFQCADGDKLKIGLVGVSFRELLGK